MKKRPQIIIRPTLKKLMASRRVAQRKLEAVRSMELSKSDQKTAAEKACLKRIEGIDDAIAKVTTPK